MNRKIRIGELFFFISYIIYIAVAVLNQSFYGKNISR